MITNIKPEYKKKPGNQDEFTRYCLVGEALCMVQHLEEVLSDTIILKIAKIPNVRAVMQKYYE